MVSQSVFSAESPVTYLTDPAALRGMICSIVTRKVLVQIQAQMARRCCLLRHPHRFCLRLQKHAHRNMDKRTQLRVSKLKRQKKELSATLAQLTAALSAFVSRQLVSQAAQREEILALIASSSLIFQKKTKKPSMTIDLSDEPAEPTPPALPTIPRYLLFNPHADSG